jgi:hypothetical protein
MKKNCLTIVLNLLVVSVFAWGQTGHRVVAEVAQNHLSKKARKNLAKIMGHESLIEASTWMDNVKSDSTYDHMRSWHYVTIPDGKDYSTSEKASDGDAYETVLRMKDVLKSEESSLEEKKEAIRILTHVIGDLHQPLHVGNGQDRGGNQIKLKWFYKSSNLHRVWDSEIIDSKGFSYSELALLIDHPNESTEVNSTSNMNVWLAEAVALRPQIYNLGEGESLSYEYMYYNWETVKEQLLKGGLRLATVLNEVLG